MKLQRRLNTLINMRADGEITKDQYLIRAAETNAQVRKVKSEIRRYKAKLARLDGSEIERAVLAVQKVLKNSTTLDAPRKSQLLCSLIQRVKAVVRRNPVTQPRDNAGHYATMSEPKWLVQDLDFELDDGDPPRAIVRPSCAHQTRGARVPGSRDEDDRCDVVLC